MRRPCWNTGERRKGQATMVFKKWREWRARHPSWYACRASLGFGNLPVSIGVFMQKTWTKGVACELGKNFVGSARRLISKSNFCRGRFPFVTVTLTVRSPRTRKGEKIRSCITVTVCHCNCHCYSPFSPHSPTRSLKRDSEAAIGGFGFHCEKFGVLDM